MRICRIAAGCVWATTPDCRSTKPVVVTEYFDTVRAYDTDWLIVLTIVEDPTYLDQPFITSTHFKREPDSSKWSPVPCKESVP